MSVLNQAHLFTNLSHWNHGSKSIEQNNLAMGTPKRLLWSKLILIGPNTAFNLLCTSIIGTLNRRNFSTERMINTQRPQLLLSHTKLHVSFWKDVISTMLQAKINDEETTFENETFFLCLKLVSQRHVISPNIVRMVSRPKAESILHRFIPQKVTSDHSINDLSQVAVKTSLRRAIQAIFSNTFTKHLDVLSTWNNKSRKWVSNFHNEPWKYNAGRVFQANCQFQFSLRAGTVCSKKKEIPSGGREKLHYPSYKQRTVKDL